MTVSLSDISGNKNNGWRKSLQKSNLLHEIPVEKKRKPCRPKKIKTVITIFRKCWNWVTASHHAYQESKATSESNYIVFQSTSQPHHVRLQKQSSDIGRIYDTHVGITLENIPSSRLPQQWRLQRYRSLRIDSGHNWPLNVIISIMTKEIRNLWGHSCTLMKDYHGYLEVVKQCVSR